jgi:hypothetical protein
MIRQLALRGDSTVKKHDALIEYENEKYAKLEEGKNISGRRIRLSVKKAALSFIIFAFAFPGFRADIWNLYIALHESAIWKILKNGIPL